METLYTLSLVVSYVFTKFALAEWLFVGSAALLLLLSLPGFLLHWAFLRRLRSAHADTWNSLGRPSVVYYGWEKTGTRVMRFIRSGSYAKLDDPYLDDLCRMYRLCIAVYTFAFVGLLSGSTLMLVASR